MAPTATTASAADATSTINSNARSGTGTSSRRSTSGETRSSGAENGNGTTANRSSRARVLPYAMVSRMKVDGPPGATKLQLELWSRVLSRRVRQLLKLSQLHFRSFANEIILDLKKTRLTSPASAAAAEGDAKKKGDKNGGKKASEKGKQDGKDVDGAATSDNEDDLAAGQYSTLLLTSHPPPDDLGSDAVAGHLMALFYRSIDDRLPPPQRKYGLDALKRAFSKIDGWVALETKSSGSSSKAKKRAIDASEKKSDGRSGKRQKKDPPLNAGESGGGRSASSAEVTGGKEGGSRNSGAAVSDDSRAKSPSSDASRERTVSTIAKPRTGKTFLPPRPSSASKETEGGEGGENPSEKDGSGKEKGGGGGKDASNFETLDLTGDDASAPPAGRGGKGKRLPLPQATSPPAPPHAPSPLPGALSNLPSSSTRSKPDPLPPPMSRNEKRSINFNADNHTPILSSSLERRSACTVTYDEGYCSHGTGSTLDDEAYCYVRDRLETWDPYWRIVEELGRREVDAGGAAHRGTKTLSGVRTTPCVPYQPLPAGEAPKSCAMFRIDLPRQICASDRARETRSDAEGPWGVRWGERPKLPTGGHETGDRRLIVRTLPLVRTDYESKKRADTHIWPSGTFLQMFQGLTSTRRTSVEQVLPLLQRKQQAHDPRLWKGLSYHCDLTDSVPDPNASIQLKLCAREVVKGPENNSDLNKNRLEGSYAIHASICEYVGADALYDQLMGKTKSDNVIAKLSLKETQEMAKGYLRHQTVSIDDSDDEDNGAKGDDNSDSGECLTFSLLCSVSKTAMETPVRGKNCKHMQCFDLRNYLRSNETISGGRWRCFVCEDWVSVRDLVHCGLFQAMIDELGPRVSGSRDRVSVRSDGTWALMEENKLRYANRRGGGGKDDSSSDLKPEADSNAGQRRPPSEPEVIELM